MTASLLIGLVALSAGGGPTTAEVRVVDDSGSPVAGAVVKFSRYQRLCWAEEPTDGDGRTAVPLRTAGGRPDLSEATELLVAHRAFAPAVVSKDSSGATVVTLPPGKPLAVRLVDADGSPVAGAALESLAWSPPGAGVVWSLTEKPDAVGLPKATDADGRLRWANAPEGHLQFSFAKAGFVSEPFAAKAGASQTVTVARSVRIAGQVTDAATGRPLKGVRSFLGYTRGGRVHGNSRGEARVSEDGRFEYDFARTDIDAVLLFSKPGYRQKTVGPIEPGTRPGPLTVPLEPAPMITGRLLKPDGTPAADEMVLVRSRFERASPSVSVMAEGERRDHFFWRFGQLRRITTDEDGRFAVPAPPAGEDACLLCGDRAGFVETPLPQSGDLGDVRLRAWGRIEGRFLSGGRPAAGVPIVLRRAAVCDLEPVDEEFFATTDDAGRFVLPRVPAGCTYVVDAELSPFDTRSPRSIRPIEVAVKPGETSAVDLNAGPVDLAGRLEVSGGGPAIRNLQHTWNVLVPAGTDAGWKDDWRTGTDMPQVHGGYAFLTDEAGAFRVDGVEPGEYELASWVYDPPENGCLVSPVARTIRPVTVSKPAEGRTQRIGVVTVERDSVVEVGDPFPGDVVYRDGHGQAYDLAVEHRGRWAVVDVWALWCGPCRAAMPELEAAAAEFADAGDVTVLALSVDADPDAAAEFITGEAPSAAHGFAPDLLGRDVSRLCGVTSLPCTLLIAPDGTLAARGRTLGDVLNVLRRR